MRRPQFTVLRMCFASAVVAVVMSGVLRFMDFTREEQTILLVPAILFLACFVPPVVVSIRSVKPTKPRSSEGNTTDPPPFHAQPDPSCKDQNNRIGNGT